eukprot:gene27630-33368_t
MHVLDIVPRGSAPGAMGWTFRLIQQMVRGHSCPAAFGLHIVNNLLNPMLAGKLNAELWTPAKLVVNDQTRHIESVTHSVLESTSGDHEVTSGPVDGGSVGEKRSREADDDDEDAAAPPRIQAVPYAKSQFIYNCPPTILGDQFRSLFIRGAAPLGKNCWAMAHLESSLIVMKRSDLNQFVAGTHRSILFVHPSYLTKMSHDELTGLFCTWDLDYYHGRAPARSLLGNQNSPTDEHRSNRPSKSCARPFPPL